MPRHIEAVASRKTGNIPGWEPFKFEKIGPDAVIIEGGVPVPPKKVGGRKRWPGPSQKCVVTDAEIAEEYKRFEAETGKCGECLGKGEVFASWHHIDGVKNRPCPKCSSVFEVSLDKK